MHTARPHHQHHGCRRRRSREKRSRYGWCARAARPCERPDQPARLYLHPFRAKAFDLPHGPRRPTGARTDGDGHRDISCSAVLHCPCVSVCVWGPGTGGVAGCFVSETLNICMLHCMHELAMRLCLPCFASQVYCSIPAFFKQKINPRLSGSFVLLQNIGSEVTVT